MYHFKRRYTTQTNGEVTVCGVTVLRVKPRWHLSPSLLEQGQNQGWLEDEGQTLRVFGENVTLAYDIVRRPGYYCCHCERAVGDSAAGREHVHSHHAGVSSPDANNPAGFRKDNFSTCILREEVSRG